MTVSKRCSVSECTGKILCKGMCNRHYIRFKKHGDTSVDNRASDRRCSIDRCERKHIARGYCRAHLDRLNRHGDPLSGQTFQGAPKHFLDDNVLPYQDDECLVWPFGRTRDGYGTINIDGRNLLVSRVVCQKIQGDPASQRHQAAHICGNGHLGCVSPKHLRWKTPVENAADRLVHGTAIRGEMSANAKLTSGHVIEIRSMKIKTLAERALVAKKFSVSPHTIDNVLRRRTWAWLEQPISRGAA